MKNHWNEIIYQVEQKYDIKSSDDWTKNGKQQLRRLQSALEIKIKSAIIGDISIAKEFLPNNAIHVFKELPEDKRKESLERYIIEKKANPKIGLRTLETHLLNKSMPRANKILNAFSIFVYDSLFEQSFIENDTNLKVIQSKSKVSPKNLTQKLEQFYDSHFWVYYFHYDEDNFSHNIGRAVLKIQDENKVLLNNVEAETATDFAGSMEIENGGQHLYFDLKAVNTREKHLRITVHIGFGRVHPLLMGVYTNIYANNSMVAGSIVLEKVNDILTIQNMKPQCFFIDEDIGNHISPSIVNFLRERAKNFLKTPAGIFTLSKLDDWKKIQIHKMERRKSRN